MGRWHAQKRTGFRSAGARLFLATIGLIAAFVIYPRAGRWRGTDLLAVYVDVWPVFPGVCLALRNTRDVAGRDRRARMLIITGDRVHVLSMPFFWLAFIDRHMPVVVGRIGDRAVGAILCR